MTPRSSLRLRMFPRSETSTTRKILFRSFGNSIVVKVFTTSISKTSNLRDLTSIFSRFKSSVIANNCILQTCALRIDMVSCTVVCIIPIPRKRLTCSKIGRYGVVPWGGNKRLRRQNPIRLTLHLGQSDSSNPRASNWL